MTRALIATQAVPGPRRQFTLASLGEATGTDGVNVNVGGRVFVGGGVWDGAFVGSGCVAEGTGEAARVGVSVAGMFDGKLQASIAKTSARIGNKVRGFIVSPLI
jgi:hypothetical protein